MGKHVTNKLAAKFVDRKNLKPGRYGDGGGLWLSIDESRARWVFRYTQHGQRKDIGLGSKRDVGLAEARRKAADFRAMIVNGLDPKAEKVKAAGRLVTFGSFALDMWEEWKKAFRNEHHTWQWRHTIEVHCKSIWQLPIDKVTRDHIVAILKPIWSNKHETASRLRQRIERVLNAAKSKGMRAGDNPAGWRGGLEALLPKPPKLQKKHYAAMSYNDVSVFVGKLRERYCISALALEFIILTASRQGEVREMTWDEVDIDAKLWTVPAHRMKAGKAHQVPLSDRARAILMQAKTSSISDIVFPSPLAKRGKAGQAAQPLSNMAFKLLMNRMSVNGITTHGFRSTFRDWAGDETKHSREVAEAALAHQIGNEVERSYRRGSALAARRIMMEDWALFVDHIKT